VSHRIWHLSAALVVVASGALGEELKAVEARRIDAPIRVDGRLDEPAWARAQVIDDFVQQDPDEGEPVTERTEVRVLYDADRLYVGFECYDSQPGRVVANEMRRDGQLWQNDNVFVLLDTYGDKRQGFFFRTNALGALSESAVTDGGQNINGDWDCIWEVTGRRHEKGWTAEFAIPFDQLRFEASGSMVWGVNFGRNIMRTNESAQWVPVPRSESWPGTYHPTYTGRLVGLEGIHSPAHFDIKTYFLGGAARYVEDEESAAERAAERDLGLDVKYGVTPNLTLDLTINTDFAQVEADQEEVNLTRFSLYFPEKREFFLEGSGLFAFGAGIGGWGPPPLSLFYSRSIGIEEDQEVPILGGGKLTGKVGPYSVGALNITTGKKTFLQEEEAERYVTDSGELLGEDDPRLDEVTIVDMVDVDVVDTVRVQRTNFSVLRLQRDIFSRSTVGLIATNKQSDTGSGYHRAGGVDLMLRPQDEWRMNAMVAGSWTPDAAEGDLAWYLANDWRNDRLHVSASYLDIGPDFTAEMGFVQRTDVRSFDLEAELDLRPKAHGIRGIGMGLSGSYLLDHDNELQGREVGIDGGAYLDSGDGFDLEINYIFDRVDEAFEVEDVEIEAGEYEMIDGWLRGGTSDSRAFAASGRVGYGGYFGGRRLSLSADSRWRATYQLAIEMRYERNRIDFGEDDFTTNIIGSRISYSLNTRFFTKLFTQWSDAENRLSANFLLNYIYRPGSDFYLVYDQVWDTSGDGLRSGAWTLLSKFTYFFSF